MLTCDECGVNEEEVELIRCKGEIMLCDECYFEMDAEDEGEEEDIQFKNQGSALRAATPDNPRIYPCPTCKAENTLTMKDVGLGYQCDTCADKLERSYEDDRSYDW